MENGNINGPMQWTTSALEILISGMITSTKNWNRQKNHDISIRHCIRQCIRHYSPNKATPLAEGEWNRRPIRVNLTFEGLELTSNPRKRLVPMLHFFPYWMTEGYRSRYQKYRVHYGVPMRSKLLIIANHIWNSRTVGYNSLIIFEAHKSKLYSQNNYMKWRTKKMKLAKTFRSALTVHGHTKSFRSPSNRTVTQR